MRKLSRWIPIIGGAIAGGIIALVIASNNHTTKSVTTTVVTSTASTQPASFAQTGKAGLSINQIYQQDAPGVVDILEESKSTSSSTGGLFGNTGSGSQESEGEGAGVVYNDKGDILTDEHVIDNATKVVVTFQNGTKVDAKVVGSDASSDVGVIKVNVPSSELHPLKFANSDTAAVGDQVVAIGSPFSQPWTVTSGIVSQTGRVIQAPTASESYFIPDAIQTDAAINPGNSGGPLINSQGEVIGLNDQIETDETNSESGQGQNAGIGFATASNADVQVANEIIAGKTVQHAYLGISVPGSESDNENLSTHSAGVTAQRVLAGGPAAKGGLKANDVIEKIDGTTLTDYDQLVSLLAEDKVGQKITLTVDRNGQTKTLTVTLGNRPKTEGNGD